MSCFYHFKCAVYTSLYFTFVTWYCDLHVCPYCLMFVAITLFFNTYLLLLFILAVSGRSCVTRDRHCGSLLQLWRVVWDLSPPARDRTWTMAAKAQSPTQWTTRELPPDSRLTSSESTYSRTKTSLLPSPTDLSFLTLGRGVIQTDSRALRLRIKRPLDVCTFPSATNIIPLHA